MSISAVYSVLSTDSTVASLAGDRISPLERKDYEFPAVVLTEVSLEPINGLAGWGGSDNSVVQVACWDVTFLGAETLAKACRSAIEAAGYAMLPGSPENFDPLAALGGIACVTYQYSIWT